MLGVKSRDKATKAVDMGTSASSKKATHAPSNADMAAIAVPTYILTKSTLAQSAQLEQQLRARARELEAQLQRVNADKAAIPINPYNVGGRAGVKEDTINMSRRSHNEVDPLTGVMHEVDDGFEDRYNKAMDKADAAHAKAEAGNAPLYAEAVRIQTEVSQRMIRYKSYVDAVHQAQLDSSVITADALISLNDADQGLILSMLSEGKTATFDDFETRDPRVILHIKRTRSPPKITLEA